MPQELQKLSALSFKFFIDLTNVSREIVLYCCIGNNFYLFILNFVDELQLKSIKMSDIYETTRRVKLYDEDIHEETALNLSSQGLIVVPKIKNQLLCVRY